MTQCDDDTCLQLSYFMPPLAHFMDKSLRISLFLFSFDHSLGALQKKEYTL
jgi:hypothetical protein